MKDLTLQRIAAVCNGQYVGPEELKKAEIQGAVCDSRQIEKGFLFIPVKGERVDGHDFVPSVFEKGALASLSEKPLENCPGPYILVKSCLTALKQIAAFYRRQLAIPIVGITGSVGKTSTKEMIAAVLSTKYRVLKTAGNFNNEIGLPLTILRIRKEHEVAVVEMGISEFGEMKRLAEIAKPDICVITNIGVCHLENLGDRDGVLKAKTEVFEHLAADATVLLNGDDDKLITVKDAGGNFPRFYGMSNQNVRGQYDIFIDRVENLGLQGTRARIHTLQGEITVEIPIPGRHQLYNAMAAAGVGLRLGLTPEEIKKGLYTVKAIGGRNNLIEANDMLIIDDCYNANPVSVKAAIDLLKSGLQRTVAVLGDMGELGENERQLHYDVGYYAAKAGIDILFFVGNLAKEMETGAIEAGGKAQVYHFFSKEEMLPHLQEQIKAGDTILVKASHFMDFTKIVEKLSS